MSLNQIYCILQVSSQAVVGYVYASRLKMGESELIFIVRKKYNVLSSHGDHIMRNFAM